MTNPPPIPFSTRSPFTCRSARAFSLIELLAVIALIGVLAALTIPAINSMGAASDVTHTAVGVAGALELARSEAVARQTYVWAAFEPLTEGDESRLLVALMASINGAPDPGQANLRPLGRILSFNQIDITEVAALGISGIPAGVSELGGNGITFEEGQRAFSAGQSITFTPQGEALLSGSPSRLDGFDPWIGIGLRGSTQPDNVVAVLVDGSTGIATIRRPQ